MLLFSVPPLSCPSLMSNALSSPPRLSAQDSIARIDKAADGSLRASLASGGTVEADCIMFATGRRPRTEVEIRLSPLLR